MQHSRLEDRVTPRSSNEGPRKLIRFTPRIKVWLETDGEYVFGFGVCAILQAVDRTGSIKQSNRRQSRWARVTGISGAASRRRCKGWANPSSRRTSVGRERT